MAEEPLFKRFFEAFINPFTAILIALATVSFVTDVVLAKTGEKDPITVIIIFTMVMISGLLRFVQETRSGNAAERLGEMVRTTTAVEWQENGRGEIMLEDVVVGDIVYLAAGDMMPADVSIIKAKVLFVTQAALTGESEPVEKIPNIIKQGEFSWILIRFMLIVVPVVLFINGFTKGDWLGALLFAISVAVGLTPEMLPMIVTTCFAKGAVAMSRKKTIIKNLNSIQNLGSMDVLCTDKTGTMTQDKVVLEYHLDVHGTI